MKKTLGNIFTEDQNDEVGRKKQRFLLTVTIVIFVSIFVAFFLLSDDKDKKLPFSLEDAKGKINISDVTGGAKAEDRWIQLAEKKLQNLDKISESIERLEQKNLELTEELAAAKSKDTEIIDHKQIVEGYYEEIARITDRMEALEGKGARKPEQRSIVLPNKVNTSPFIGEAGDSVMPNAGIANVNFSLSGSKGDFKHFNTSEYLPAGSYVSALVISGVDASVGISSQSDPRPVLFRIDGKAKSAAHDNKELEVAVKGCVVTGAASGDLSSEKVFVRLLKMTCANDDNSVIETDVKGYASAVGKAGVRGPVTSREGDLVVKSFFAGIAGGVGSGVAERMTTPTTILGPTDAQKPTTQDILGKGLGRGVETSADRIAEYLIDRAEQYQPVITISAGLEVELVFHEGVYLDGRKKEAKNEK